MTYRTPDGSQVSTRQREDGSIVVAYFAEDGSGVKTRVYTADEWREALLNGEIKDS